MTVPRLFVCSGAKVSVSDPIALGRHPVVLDAVGSKPNVHIRLENLAKVFCQNLAPRLVDFLEIASYVFSADCATPRGRKWTEDESSEPWGRDLAFVIPVRDPPFWRAAETKLLIEEILNFLSNDKFSFNFVPLQKDRANQQEYFQFGDSESWPFHNADRVLMFSGGLDSLAGAVETAAGGSRAVLVSHRPVSKLDARQKGLFRELQKNFPDQLIRVPVWINKDEFLGREPTQRTRSFLYSALGTLVAESVKADGVRFYENGIVSLNLPLAQEVLRARASRTTHPVALHLLSALCSAVTERTFAVDNPYWLKTKTEVVESLVTHGADHLIARTCSCSHLMFQSKIQRHCGCCSQCTDRRFAVAAAGLSSQDPGTDYVSDVFVGPRKELLDREIAVDYARHGIELARRAPNDLATTFNAEISRAVRYEPNRREAAQKIVAMYKRHGESVVKVLEQKVHENVTALINGTLDSSSLLRMVVAHQYRRSQDQLFADTGEGESCPMSELATLEESLRNLHAKFDAVAIRKTKTRAKRRLTKRDVVIFAAILRGLESMTYCSFLKDHGIQPKWSGQGLPGYPRAYQDDASLRKKIQDEKSRAKVRMNDYSNAELATAFANHFHEEFDQLSPLLHSRNSQNASKNLSPRKPH